MVLTSNSLSVLAPAKVNLHLAVKEKRPDGFHNLESVFLALDWGDELFIEWSGEPLSDNWFDAGTEQCSVPGLISDELSMTWNNTDKEKLSGKIEKPISVSDNIISKAISLFREKTGYNKALKIKVEKYIPICGGLGGGSSNAAAILLALNRISGLPLEQNALLEIGASLGSDVPFFLHEITAAWVTGRGEFIQPFNVSPFFIVLVNPGFSSSTAEAFYLLDEFRKVESRKEEVGSGEGDWNFSFFTSSFYNDFLPVFPDKEKSVYNQIITSLKELGADFASLSGAGSTCFGIFKDYEQAKKASVVLNKEWEFVKYCCVKNY